MSQVKGLHDGHRDRVRERFLLEGLDKFRDHQALELLLFYAIPRKDTNDTSHILLNRFGSLSGVLDAPIDALVDAGLSKNAAVLLKMMPEFCSRYYKDKYQQNGSNTINSDNIGEAILQYFIGADEEQVLLVLLDPKGKRLFCDIISKGSISASEVNIKKILQYAVKYKASGAVIAHNHPSGIALPSKTDISVTISLRDSLSAIGVTLLDHIIVADMEFTCMSELEEFEEIFFHK